MIIGHVEERGSSQGKRVVRESKTPYGSLYHGGMDIYIPFSHIPPSLMESKIFPERNLLRISILPVNVQKKFLLGNDQKFLYLWSEQFKGERSPG
jgi:hypothetical protein